MRIKRYVSSDVRQAIRKIRDELGPDAVILSNRKVEGGVEIAAAIDYDDAWADASTPTATSSETAEQYHPGLPAPRAELPAEPSVPPRPESAVEAPWAEPPSVADDGLVAVGRELNSLRGLLEQQLSGLAWGELARRHPVRAIAHRQLLDLGMSRKVAQFVADQISDDIRDPKTAWRRALGILAHHIRVSDSDILDDGGVIAMLGSTGVGKTTTVAKLAARFALRHGAQQVALVTTDSYRVGAHEQLRAFAQIMGIPVRVSNDLAELRNALEHYCDRKLLLIDTAGMSQRDVRFAKQIALVQDGSPLVKSYLVISATAQHLALEEAVRAFSDTRLDGCVITKTDEATSLGPALSTICQHRIPVAYVSHGQRVPEDISSARAHLLVTRAVTMAQRAHSPGGGKQAAAYGGLQVNASY